MKILKQEENIASIVSMISNAKEFVVIVSPFNDLAGWDELINTINEAGKRIKVAYYVRKDEGRNGIEDIRVPIYETPLLHAKMFFSENEAIISSGNLTNHPDINWFCRLNMEEYDQIVNFFHQYIEPGSTQLL